MIAHPLLDFTDRSVPRYTSYPAAPHFHGGVDGHVYGDWLESLSRTPAPVSLYLHVPFCRSVCFYCGCSTKATRRDEPLAAYAVLLRKELAMVASRTGRLPVSHMHWGGGTPNLLPSAVLAGIVADIRRDFDILPDAEHAMEIDPRYLTPEGAASLAAAGVTRVSLGVQDFDSAVQMMIGRIQPFDTVVNAAESLRQVGIRDFNFDLIYGLPGQTVESIDRTVRLAVSLNPSRIAMFGYAHVPWFRANQRLIDEEKLPDRLSRIRLAETARGAIESEGYVAVGIDHFARPTDSLARAASARTLRRNFQGYTTDAATSLIGVGASSVGQMPQGYVQNAADTSVWTEAIGQGQFAVVKGLALTAEDRLRAEVIAELLCYFDVDYAAIALRHGFGAGVFAGAIEELAPLVDAGFLRIEAGRVTILREGPALARVVASAFDAYLKTGARHSLAV
ncbi:MAG: oxygen-independent coproporphyrinogen III oxidase [Beijerinckiaceae bacterium]|nr:oxygen-independent coproporphyrinogen III oxidase [Beijerinckiaceae bacterium]